MMMVIDIVTISLGTLALTMLIGIVFVINAIVAHFEMNSDEVFLMSIAAAFFIGLAWIIGTIIVQLMEVL